MFCEYQSVEFVLIQNFGELAELPGCGNIVNVTITDTDSIGLRIIRHVRVRMFKFH